MRRVLRMMTGGMKHFGLAACQATLFIDFTKQEQSGVQRNVAPEKSASI